MNRSRLHIGTLLFILALAFALPFKALSQTGSDTVVVSTVDTTAQTDTAKHKMSFGEWMKTPASVAVRSAIIPGWGQVSNRQAWKLPILYGGLATSTYFIVTNNTMFQRLLKAYNLRMDGDTATIDEFDPSPDNPHPAKEGRIRDPQSLLDLREQYRGYRDLSVIVTFGIYAVNILDAYVYAHLKDFDVSDDLTLAVEPVNFTNIAGNNYMVTGIKLKFR